MIERQGKTHRRPAAQAIVLALGALLFVAACGDDDATGPLPTPDMFEQMDRFGLPAINTVFIPSAMKQDYNESVPANDRANFRDEVLATLAAFGVVGDAAEGLADAVLPDIQPINTAMPTAFLNGRKPSDDVITAELMLIFGGNAALNDDHVDANDVAFLATFPYLAPPHP
ncbi:MAG TPA: DUF4331 family protein [Gemmatimonadota bacterium]|nr:DUF4331 family protein [Gemmatimonadota bacterium]